MAVNVARSTRGKHNTDAVTILVYISHSFQPLEQITKMTTFTKDAGRILDTPIITPPVWFHRRTRFTQISLDKRD